MKRVLIQANDESKYVIIDKFELKKIQQVEYGNTILPIENGEPIRTPVIWVIFINISFYANGKVESISERLRKIGYIS